MSESKEYLVYCHINKQNNKKYIGITSQKPEKRWGKNGSNYLSKNCAGEYIHKVFAQALLNFPDWQKNWEHIILEEKLSKEEAIEKEKYYISKFHTFIKDPQCQGYNMTLGGDGNIWMFGSEKQKEEARKKISKKAKLRFANKQNHPRYGVHLSEETKQKISLKNKGKPAYFKGKHLSEETKQKISESHTGKILSKEHKKNISIGVKKFFDEHPEVKEKTIHYGKDNGFSKQVKCLNTGEIFECVRAAMDWCGLKGSGDIGSQIKGKHKTAGKHPITKEPLRWSWVEKELK